MHGRAEDIAHNKSTENNLIYVFLEQSRNLQYYRNIAFLLLKLGLVCAYKSQGIEKELAESQNAYKLLGGHLEKNNSISIDGFGLDHRILMIKN